MSFTVPVETKAGDFLVRTFAVDGTDYFITETSDDEQIVDYSASLGIDFAEDSHGKAVTWWSS